MARRRTKPEEETAVKDSADQAAEAVAAESTPEGEPAPDAPVEEEPKEEKKSGGRRSSSTGDVEAYVSASGSVAWMDSKGLHHHGETGTNIKLPKDEFDRLSELGVVEKGHVEGAPFMYADEEGQSLSARQASEAVAVESETPEEVVNQR